jgi:hypothetical protein
VVAVVLVATSGSDHQSVGPTPKTTTTRPTATVPHVRLVIGSVHVRSVGPKTKVRPSLRHALLRAAQRYVDDAIIGPLERGRAIPGYAKMYDPIVKRPALRRDLAELTEAKTRLRSKRVHASASRVRLDALGGPDGQPALVALTWRLDIDTVTSKGRLAIRRRTELTFAKEFGRWLVTAYQVDVERSVGKHRKTTAAHAG